MDGAAGGGYMLNGGDPGLLASLDRLSAEEASATTETGASAASHVRHVLYGLSLLNRWAAGENPFAEADWTESWKHPSVDEAQWRALRQELADEAHRWAEELATPRAVGEVELKGMIGSIGHLAYHLGAIRQMHRTTRGPTAEQS